MNIKNIKCVIFDLDGTLTDTLKSLWMATNLSLKDAGLSEQPLDSYRYFVGDGADMQIRRAVKAAGDDELVNYDFVRSRYNEHFAKYVNYEVKAYDGIKELLVKLKEKGIKLAVNTNKPEERAIDVVRENFGDSTFDLVVGQVAEREKKPSAEGVFYILDKLSLEKENAVYIGDTAVDMKTGKNAGVFSVGALWGFRDYEELATNGADAIIEKPLDLLKYIGE